MKIHLALDRILALGLALQVANLMAEEPSELDKHLSSKGFDPLHNSVVRVVVGNSVASGFLWNDQYHVVTSLHALRPQPTPMHVECHGIPYRASVRKVLQKADLALLKTSDKMERCEPLSDFEANRPRGKPRLSAYGFKPGIPASTSQNLFKASAATEDLANLVSEDLAKALKPLKMPWLNLPIYFVNGSVYKGYSGGPVFREGSEKVLGIVEGGLDKGTSSHNWLIPAAYIGSLMKTADVSDVPASDILLASLYYSAPAYKLDSSNSIRKQTADFNYNWLKTKTRAFKQLAISADPAEGLSELWEHISPDTETDAQEELKFDIYEDQNLGLIIVVPANEKLEYKKIDNEWQLWALHEKSNDQEALLKVQHGYLSFDGPNGTTLKPTDPQFFKRFVDGRLLPCKEKNRSCVVDTDVMRLIDFGGGRKMLKIGYAFQDPSTRLKAYIYESVAIKGNEVLVSQAWLNFGDDSPVAKCLEVETPSACGNAYWAPTSYLIAAHLTSMSSLSLEAAHSTVQTDFEYECINCVDDPTTGEISTETNTGKENVRIEYVSDSGDSFVSASPGKWVVFAEGTWENATEIARDEFFVYLKLKSEMEFSVPIYGGPYRFRRNSEDSWLTRNVVRAKEQ